MKTVLVLALFLGQFVHESPNYAVVNAPVVRYSIPPDLADCKLATPYKFAVQVTIQVGADGNAKSQHIAHTSGNPCVDKRVLLAASHYRFSPGLKEGKPISAPVTLGLNVGRDQ